MKRVKNIYLYHYEIEKKLKVRIIGNYDSFLMSKWIIILIVLIAFYIQVWLIIVL